MTEQPIKLVCILGPTAAGKTRLAACLAAAIPGEVISVDSRQVYRHLNLGTGKDLADYVVDGQAVPYHLIDIVDLDHEYNVYEYKRDCVAAMARVSHRLRSWIRRYPKRLLFMVHRLSKSSQIRI